MDLHIVKSFSIQGYENKIRHIEHQFHFIWQLLQHYKTYWIILILENLNESCI